MLVSFSPTTGHTLPDRYIEGTCPICGYPEARGDQCDNCGNQLDPTDLIEPRSLHRRHACPSSARPSTSSSTCRSSPSACASWIALARRLASERAQLLARAARRDPAAPDHPRPRLGRADPRARLRRGREQADLRLVRRRHRLPLGLDRVGGVDAATRRRGGSGGRTPRPSTTTSRARTTSSSTP